MPTTAADAIWTALGGDAAPGLDVVGEGGLPGAFAVTELAAGSVGAACMAVASLVAARHGVVAGATVDRRLTSLWFQGSIRPEGWALPPAWDAVAGDYRAADGWIRLHTNAPRHRAAALRVLGVAAERGAVAEAVARWTADALEAALVEAGGCAAAMRGLAGWASHLQGRAVATEPLVHREAGAGGPEPRWTVPRARPLSGVRVLDMTRILAGPVATRFLAGWGADVLRIDPPGWDEPSLAPDVTLGKRCARLDLRDAAARAAWEALLRQADVLVHGYRPGALDALGLDAAARRALCPGLVEVSLDAYGWTGPWAGRRGFDSLVQMSSGIAREGMRRSGADRPVPLPVQALDHATGYLMAAAAVRGLEARLRTGMASTWRASLARTAGLLVALGTEEAAPLGADRSDDWSPGLEDTAWGLARRLRPAGAIEGAAMAWDRPASPLGSARPAW